MSLATQVTALATRIATEIKAVRAEMKGAHFVYKRNAALSLTTTPTTMVWDTLLEGTLANFTTSDSAVFTCTKAGTYSVKCKITLSTGTASYNCFMLKNATTYYLQYGSAASGAYVSVDCVETITLAVGDTIRHDLSIGSGTLSVVNGPQTRLAIDYLHA